MRKENHNLQENKNHMFTHNFKYYSLFFFVFLFLKLNAQQNPVEPCGYKYEIEKIIKKKPNFIIWQSEWYKQAHQEYIELQSSKRGIISDTEFYEIPIVFHVIYNTVSQNISDALILSQLNELNLDFRKLNPDTSRIRPIFQLLSADVKIQFKLATKDPNGNPTSGINRVQTTATTFAINQSGSYNENMKSTANGGQDAWDPSKYLNIWICNMEYPNYFGLVYGFATPPTGAPNWGQFPSATRDTTNGTTGAVFHYKIVGKNNPLAPIKYKEGNTATHEIGHYLGMRHIWGDAQFSSLGCSVDDGIFDTPNAKTSNSLCTNQNSCIDAINDKPDMTENYMDYSLDGCAAMFTKEQAFMMRYVLNNFRTGLPARKINYHTIKDKQDSLNKFPNTQVSIYPNPSNGKKNINILINANDSNITFNLALIDNNGKQIIIKKFKANIKDDLMIESYSPSVYYIIISDESGNFITKQKLVISPEW
jgi:hypothetical protein